MQKLSEPRMLPLRYDPFINDYVSFVREYMLAELKNVDCKIFLFGSRAKNTNHRFSDIDVGILFLDDEVHFEAEHISDHINNESFVPVKVEIVDFEYTDPTFREKAMQNVIWWKE